MSTPDLVAQAQAQATILSLRHTVDVLRERLAATKEQLAMAERERAQIRDSAMRYARAALLETIRRIKDEHMEAMLQHASSAEVTPAEQRREVLLEALEVAYAGRLA